MWAAIIVAVTLLGRWAFSVDTHAQEGGGPTPTVTPPTLLDEEDGEEEERNAIPDCDAPDASLFPACWTPTPTKTSVPTTTYTPVPTSTPVPTPTLTRTELIQTAVAIANQKRWATQTAVKATSVALTATARANATATFTPTPKATAIQGGPTPTPDPRVPTDIPNPNPPTATPTPRPGQPSPSFLFDAQILYEQTKPIQDATQTHWSVLHWADVDVQITNAPGSTADPQNYSFTLHLNSADTGFYVATAAADCGPSSWTFTGPPGPIRLIRCGLGSTSNTGMKITGMLNPSGPTFDVMSTGRIEQG